MADEYPQNRLSSESSPYLLQHADNPVNWFPWGKEAFQQASQEDKPVFLSIGYATCHWCHVMAHESFEDPQVADLMNEAFINIKVDREERPDIDNTYMQVCQMLTGSGGWPMNVLLTPDKKPFYAATYIPKQGRHGRPGMLELIPRLSHLWNNERNKVLTSSDEITQAFQKSTKNNPGEPVTESTVKAAYQQFRNQFDEEYGGFNEAPKFPSPHNLMLLLRYAKKDPDSAALQMVEKTLNQMRRGGLFDHVGYGFHRYATDRKWLVPHFEKMLYDQALLMMAYTEAWLITGKIEYKKTVEQVTDYLFRKMQDPKGGFYSAEDADSEGEEGKFYVWNVDEIRELLSPAEAELFLEVYNFSSEGNYRDEASGRRTGKNIPHRVRSIQELAKERDMKPAKLTGYLEDIRKKVLQERQRRVPPLLDDKILTDWNGLLIAALAKAGRALDEPTYTAAAKKCFNFIQNHLIDDQGQLKHRWRNGNAAIEGHADDYAFLIWGLIELYETSYETQFLQHALSLQNHFNDQYWDQEKGGFYFTAESGEELLGRKKETYDGALPSSNSIALMNLLKLARMTGNTTWEERTDTMIRLFASDIRQAPTGFSYFLQGVQFAIGPSREVIFSGFRNHQSTQDLIRTLQTKFLPHSVSMLYEPEDTQILQMAPFLSDFDRKGDWPAAFVCHNYRCEQPVHEEDALRELLASVD